LLEVKWPQIVRGKQEEAHNVDREQRTTEGVRGEEEDRAVA
jgi:hypothetical protein